MALSPSLVDIFLSSMSQVQSKRSGPIGRVLTAKNVNTKHYDPGAQPPRISLKQRNGFTAYSTDLRLVSDGTTVASFDKWFNPELLSSLDNQPVSICNAVPRVWNGESWGYYENVRAVTNKLTQEISYTSNHTLQVPTSAVINGVTCAVWTETLIQNSQPVTSVFISVRAQDGAWLRAPQVLDEGETAPAQSLAKVVADPDHGWFWVVFNKVGLGGEKIGVHVYDTNGALLATKEIVRNDTTTPGYWDITRLLAGTVNYYAVVDATTYTDTDLWYFPFAALPPGCVGGRFTVSGDPQSGFNQTYTIQSYTDPFHISATPTPLGTYDIPPASAFYFGSDTWNFPDSTLDIPVGSTITITNSTGNVYDGVYTVLTWDNGGKIATMSPSQPAGGGPVGSGATIEVTYSIGSYGLDSGDTIEFSYNQPERIVLIQPTDPITPSNGVDFSILTYDGASTITETRNTDLSVLCIGPVSWITNDLGDHLGYFATLQGGEGDLVHGYQTTGAGQTHDYSTGININDAKYLDSFIGWAEQGINPHQPSVNIGTTYLSDGSTSDTGPTFDPAYRHINVNNTDFFDVTDPFKSKICNFVVPVSRAFLHDGEYYAFTYYQSGSGLAITPDSETVSIDSGVDYMTGAQTQDSHVAAGDYTTGATFATTGYDSTGSVLFGAFAVNVSYAQTVSIASSGDTVTPILSNSISTLGSTYPCPVYQPITILKWHIAAITRFTVSQNIWGGNLIISGSAGVSGADGTYYIVGWDTSSGTFYTLAEKDTGALPNGTFSGSSGHAQTVSVTMYSTVPNPAFTSDAMQAFYVGGNITVTGSGTADGSKTIDHLWRGSAPYWPAGCPDMYAVIHSTESTTSNIFAAQVSPATVGKWSFAFGTTFDSSLIGSNLVVADQVVGANNGSFEISAAFTGEIDTTGADASGLQPEIFGSPPPSITINLADGVRPYTFSFANITVDYTYQDATIIVEGSDTAANNTSYTVQDIDVVNNLLYATPTDGSSDQLNQKFTTETVTIIKSLSIVAPWQPTWFLTPLTGAQPMVGKFDTGIAYADWRIEADTTLGPNEFPLALGDVCDLGNGAVQIALPYRAQNVTSNLPVATVRGQINLAGAAVTANTVGLKTWTLHTETGTPALNSGELLLPGPMAGEFTLSGFFEDGINLGFEQPYLRSQAATPAGQLGLTGGQKYQYIVIGEYTDLNGNRIFTPPSPALNIFVAAGMGVVTLQGRLMNPLDFRGDIIDGEVGTSCRLVGISIYRTAIKGSGANAQPTVTHFKVTDDLAVNGLAPISSLNSSGFSFPDDFTWQYIDQNPDVTILGAEQLYTDKGYLPRYPAPAFTFGIGSWKNRTWVIASDGSIWMSGEKTEGDAVWFHPAFRYVLPTDDRPIAMANMEDNLIIFCEQGSVWQIPAATFPDATGRNGTLPTPIQLPFNVKCTGHAVSLRSAVAFSSDARGPSVWAITRDLKLVWLSQQIQDALTEIRGLTVDADQNLHVSTGAGVQWFVFDQVADCWFEYLLPESAILSTTTQGLPAFQSNDRVFVYDPNAFTDFDGFTHFPIAPDVTLADVNFSTVRGLKNVWEMQLVGTYKGPHRLNIELSYPDEYQEATTTFEPFTPDPSAPYIVPFNPLVEEAASYGIRFYADFVGVDSPGDSFEVELITAEVGIDRKTGADKQPDSQTAVANTSDE